MSKKKNCNPLESIETHRKYHVDNPLRNNPTEKRDSVIQKKKIMLHKTKEYATDVIPNPTVESWEEELKQILIEWEGKDNAILGAVRVLSRTKRLEQFISSQIQQAEERLVERIKLCARVQDCSMCKEYLASLKEKHDK